MSVDENVRVIDAVDAAGNERDWDRWAALHAEDVRIASPELGRPLRGRDAHLEQTRALIEAFPDAHLDRHRIFGQGEWLCGQYTVTGTHRGALRLPQGPSLDAAGRTIELAYCTVFRIQKGKIVEEHNYYDLLSLLGQLGLAP